jgi:hypothetical protein
MPDAAATPIAERRQPRAIGAGIVVLLIVPLPKHWMHGHA